MAQMQVIEYDQKRVDIDDIRVEHPADNETNHRFALTLPLEGRPQHPVWHVLGQNPSAASKTQSDRTINFVIRTLHELRPEVGSIRMLNLFSRYDPDKSQTDDFDHPDHPEFLERELKDAENIWLVCGKLEKQGVYDFPARFEELRKHLVGKRLWCMDVNWDGRPVPYATHPRRVNFSDHYKGKRLTFQGQLRPYRLSVGAELTCK